MALISCPECSASVSSQASSCPQCGHPMTAGRKHAQDAVDGMGSAISTVKLIFSLIFVFIVLSAVIRGCASLF